MDGVLDEPFWSKSEIASNFVQNIPNAGDPSIGKTEVRLAYNDEALYIGAIMFDDRDSMSLTLSQRDDEGNADWIGFILDPYHAGTIGFTFVVTSAGVQMDILEQARGRDKNWNAVWQSKVEVYNDRWIAEIKIPFSAIRFPKEDVQTWGINFARNIRRHREQSHWSFVDPEIPSVLAQLGTITGISNIDSPFRLFFYPYVSGYMENYNVSTGYTANGGMDVKYGINDAFTLDVTLIPDFGQVQFDNQVLNLSPFEVRFNERRQFFTEGTELFNKAGLFYSRRIGSTPVNSGTAYSNLGTDEIVQENSLTSQLLNATKLSGRTRKGTGIGLFNAVTANEYAVIVDTISGVLREHKTGPLSNYNVFVIDQNLKRNNSTITFTNTNVMRDGETYDANVTGLQTNLNTKGQKYNLLLSGSLSQQFFATDSTQIGHQFNIRGGKSAGKFRVGGSYSESSKTYDINDLGFQRTNNLRNMSSWVNYNTFTPVWRFIRTWTGLNLFYQNIQENAAFTQFNINLNAGGIFRNFLACGINVGITPVRPHDYFEPRVEGRYYEGDQSAFSSIWWSSDYSKVLALDGGLTYWVANDDRRYGLGGRLSPRWRMSDRMNLILNVNVDYAQNVEGVAVGTNGIPFDQINPENPIFAKRDRWTVINTVDYEFIFNNLMGFTFRLRHYWSTVEYNEFFQLNAVGQFDPTTYTGYDSDDNSYHDNAFNAFTIDAAYRWIFSQGSELSLVWKNSIFSSSDQVRLNYFQNLETLGQNPATNSLSLKILFFIDYWSVHQKVFKGKKVKD